jgi:hypothetical protein
MVLPVSVQSSVAQGKERPFRLLRGVIAIHKDRLGKTASGRAFFSRIQSGFGTAAWIWAGVRRPSPMVRGTRRG